MSNKVTIIAEAGVNHNGLIENAFKLIDVAVEAGADIVKFQSFRADKLAIKDAPKAQYQIEKTGTEESQHDMLKRLELSEQDHQELIAYCNEKGIEFLSTPFDIDGLHMLIEQFGLTTIKLGSSDLINAPILLAAAQTGCQVILSTGMGTLYDIEEALGVLAYGYLKSNEPPSRDAFKEAWRNPKARAILSDKVVVLHCTTAYPAPFSDVNLKAMQTIQDQFHVTVGYSDHTLGIEVSVAAVAMGAQVIEKHFTLDTTMEGPDHAASLEPNELKALVQSIRNIEVAMGDGVKQPAEGEKINMQMARKSLVASRTIKAGEVFTAENISIKRPANGRPPIEYWDFLGKEAARDYTLDEPL